MDHLVEYGSYCPYIAFGSVGLFFKDLQGHIEGSAYCGLVLYSFGDVLFCESEVSDFNDILAH
jgi:hypothetical protein